MKILTLVLLAIFSTSRLQSGNFFSPSAQDSLANSNSVLTRSGVVTFSEKYLGAPYRTGGTNPKKGFDCSGFVRFVFNNFHIILPHSSRAYESIGKPLKPEEFRIGDILVFYGFKDSTRIGHVGIICEANGMKSKFIHSSSGVVRGVIISSLGLEMYTRRFYKCIDVTGIKQK
jgi:cell wall-associated NlpC family hydrolase